MSDQIKERMGKWKTALKDAATGPLVIASEVVDTALEWDPKQNDDREFSGALEDALGDGKNLRFFQLRAAAVQQIGGMRDARMFEHHAAVWLSGKATNGVLAEAVRVAATAYLQNRKVPLTTSQVRRACRDVLGIRQKVRIDETAALRAEIERLKIELAVRDERIEELLQGNERRSAQVKTEE